MDGSSDFMDTPTVPTDPTYVPFTQPFWITLQDGSTQVESGITDINVLRMLSVYQAISQAAQVGAAVILLAAIFLMTKSEKRRSSVFCLNAISLLLVVIRGAFQLATVTGPFYEFWRWKTHTYIDLGDAKSISACSEAASFLLTVAILLSLFVQVRIVCCNLSDARRWIVNILNAIVIAVAVAMRLALMVLNIRWNIMDLSGMPYSQFMLMGKMASAANITLVISIAFSTVIFTAKLASAIIARRSMGITQFGPMQIIFVMGCQTMFTPRKHSTWIPFLFRSLTNVFAVIFTIITYTTIKNSNVHSFVPFIVAISLPLSGMWAAVNTENVHIANPDPRKHRVVNLGPSKTSFTGISMKKGPSTTSTYYDDDKYGLTASPSRTDAVDGDPDLEMGKIGDGVNVKRTYSVRSD